MGFYPPDALVHEAQRRGIEVLAPDVNESGLECDVELAGAAAVGLGYRGSRADRARLRARGARRGGSQLVVARESAGDFGAGRPRLPRGCGCPALELLAWSGACDRLVGDRCGRTGPGAVRNGAARRIALWQLGVTAPGRRVPGGTQLALPLDLPAPPALPSLSEWEGMLADYASTGLTAGTHPLALLRPRLPTETVTSHALETLPHGRRVRIGGMVVARQRPGTAGGVVFLLLEDEHGTINLIIPPGSTSAIACWLDRAVDPRLGKLEKLAAAGGAINVLVDRIDAIDAPDQILAAVKDFSMLDEQVRQGLAAQRAATAQASASTEAEDFRAVAPPVMSFASGRRR